MVNPGKLKALVDTHQVNPGMAALANPSATPPEPGEEDDDDLDDEEEPEEAGDPKAKGESILASWGDDGEKLKEEAGEIVDAAHDVGPNLLLAQVPEDTIEEVEDKFDRMPDDMQVLVAKRVAKLAPDDVTALATALCDGHDGDTEVADVKLVATYLTTLAAHAAEEVDPKDLEDEDADEKDETGPEETGEHPPVPAAPPAAAATPPAAKA